MRRRKLRMGKRKFSLIMCIFTMLVFGYTNLSANESIKVKKIETDANTMFVLDSQDNLWIWGSDEYGYLRDNKMDTTEPIVIMKDVIDFTISGDSYFVVKNDNSLWVWGNNKYGELGTGNTFNVSKPKKIMDNIVSIYSRASNTMAIKTDSSLWAWGSNSFGGLGDGTRERILKPKKVFFDVQDVSIGVGTSLLLTNEGDLYCLKDKSDHSGAVWTFLESGIIDVGGDLLYITNDNVLKEFDSVNESVTELAVKNVKKIIDDTYPSKYFIKNDDSLWGWTDEYYLNSDIYSNTTKINSSKPIKVFENIDLYSESNEFHTGVLTNRKLVTWEGNSFEEMVEINLNHQKISEKTILDSDAILFDSVVYNPKDSISVFIDNELLSFDVPPEIIDGRTLVPMRTIFEKLGLEVLWDNVTKSAIGNKENINIKFEIGSNVININGKNKNIDVPAQIIKGKTMVPLRVLSEVMGYNVVWTGESKNILISKSDIVEWRFGGYEAIIPAKEYESKFINGERTSENRYTGNYREYAYIVTPENKLEFLDSNNNWIVFEFENKPNGDDVSRRFGYMDNEILDSKSEKSLADPFSYPTNIVQTLEKNISMLHVYFDTTTESFYSEVENDVMVIGTLSGSNKKKDSTYVGSVLTVFNYKDKNYNWVEFVNPNPEKDIEKLKELYTSKLSKFNKDLINNGNVPLLVKSSSISYNSIGIPQANIVFESLSLRRIKAIEVSFKCYDDFGNPVNKFSGSSNKFFGVAQNQYILLGDKVTFTWVLNLHELTTNIRDIKITNIAYID